MIRRMATSGTIMEILAKGKVLEVKGEIVVFQPAGTSYELHLVVVAGKYDGPIARPVECLIRARARKVYTVPSGGNFIQPIFGPPRVIQGRVRALDSERVIVHAGAPIAIDLPAEEHAIDLNRGPITVGSMVNVIALPGATVEFRNDER
jgi:hypothetical protein